MVGLFLVIVLVAGAGLYYQNNLKTAEATKFFNLVLHDLPTDASSAIIALDDYIAAKPNPLVNKDFYNSFATLIKIQIEANQYLTTNIKDFKNDPALLLKTNNSLLNDIYRIELAKAYLNAKEFDKALEFANGVQSPTLLDLKLITLARINIAQNNILSARSNLKKIIDQGPSSQLWLVAYSYYTSI